MTGSAERLVVPGVNHNRRSLTCLLHSPTRTMGELKHLGRVRVMNFPAAAGCFHSTDAG